MAFFLFRLAIFIHKIKFHQNFGMIRDSINEIHKKKRTDFSVLFLVAGARLELTTFGL